MTESEFMRSVRETLPLMNDLNVLRNEYWQPVQQSQRFSRASFNPEIDYPELFMIGLEEQDYTFLLSNLSYIQLLWESAGQVFSVQYGFYPNPYGYNSFEGFLEEFEITEYNPRAIELYNQYMTEMSVRYRDPPIRYDLDFESHVPLQHPCAHLHIGHHTNIRWPVSKIWTPKMFSLFMIKSFFTNEWNENNSDTGCDDPPYFEEALIEAKENSPELDERHFTQDEHHQPHLS